MSETLFTVSFLWLRTVRVVSVLTHYICLSHLSTDAAQHIESILWMQYASLNMGGIWASVLCRGHEVRQNHLKLLHHCKTRDCTAGWSSGVLCTWNIARGTTDPGYWVRNLNDLFQPKLFQTDFSQKHYSSYRLNTLGATFYSSSKMVKKKLRKFWKQIWKKVENIARGTTDPGYWVYDLNHSSD